MTSAEDENNDVALAGEYALHLMDSDERKQFEKRLLDNQSLRNIVREWDESLISLADGFKPVAPPADLQAKIEKLAFADIAPEPSTWWSLKWLGGGLVAAGVLAAFLLFSPQTIEPTPSEPAYFAQIESADSTLVLQASLTQETDQVVITRTAGGPLAGRALELWYIPVNASVPVSLGVLSGDDITEVVVPEALRPLTVGGTFAVSDEPLGGSPTGQPTGAVLAAGLVSEI